MEAQKAAFEKLEKEYQDVLHKHTDWLQNVETQHSNDLAKLAKIEDKINEMEKELDASTIEAKARNVATAEAAEHATVLAEEAKKAAERAVEVAKKAQIAKAKVHVLSRYYIHSLSLTGTDLLGL